MILSGIVPELSLTHSLDTGRGLEISLTRDAARVGSKIEAVHSSVSDGLDYMRLHMVGATGKMGDVDLSAVVEGLPEKECNALKGRLTALVSGIEDVKSKLDDAQGKLNESENAKAALESQLSELRALNEAKEAELDAAKASAVNADELRRGQEAAEKIYQDMLYELSANLRNCGVEHEEFVKRFTPDSLPMIQACNKAFSKMLGEDTMRKRRMIDPAPAPAPPAPVVPAPSALEKALGDTFELL